MLIIFFIIYKIYYSSEFINFVDTSQFSFLFWFFLLSWLRLLLVKLELVSTTSHALKSYLFFRSYDYSLRRFDIRLTWHHRIGMDEWMFVFNFFMLGSALFYLYLTQVLEDIKFDVFHKLFLKESCRFIVFVVVPDTLKVLLTYVLVLLYIAALAIVITVVI